MKILITGSSRGIDAAIAKTFAQNMQKMHKLPYLDVP